MFLIGNAYQKPIVLMEVMFMVIISVDIGKARTGLAICDKGMFLASPLLVIEDRRRENVIRKVALTAEEKKAQRIVVGLPKNMDGSEGESAVSAREFADELSKITEIPVVLYDERCTTMIAHRYLNDSNTRGKKRKQAIDSAAAAIILQSYIDYLKNSKEED